ncbi:MAG: Uma2 family endonuclease [Acidobacteria bacterium]|nr:Uma2 family endonuclease [Acidobacteriota bacterium]
MANAWPPVLEPSQGTGRGLSLQEWLDLPEDSEGELVSGHLTEEEMPDAVHELAIGWLIWLLRQWLSGEGFVFGSDLKILTGPDTGRKPDLTVFLPGTQPPPRRGPITHPPDILVEVITPSPRDERRDRVEKMAEYARFAVKYYWLIDPALGSFEIFELTAQSLYQKVVGVTSGVIDPVPGCAGLQIDVTALWTELARLADDGA